MLKGIFSKELFYAAILMIGSISYGMILVFPSAAVPLMIKDHPAANWERALFNCVACIGAIPGPYISNFILKKHGRRPTTCLVATYAGITWCFYLLSSDTKFWVYIIMRLLNGVALGALSAIIPIFIVDLAPSKTREFYSAINPFGIVIGILLNDLIGAFGEWRVNVYVGLALNFLLIVAVWSIPRIPKSKRIKDKAIAEETFMQSKYMVPLAKISTLMFFKEFSGTSALLVVLATTLKITGLDKINPNFQAAITTLAQFIAVVVCGSLLRGIGWKLSWILSGVSSSIFLILSGLNAKFHWASWLPLVSISVFLFLTGIGMDRIPWKVLRDSYKPEKKTISHNVGTSCNWLITAIAIFIATLLQTSVSTFAMFIFFACFSLVGSIVGYFLIPDSVVPQDDDTAINNDNQNLPATETV